MKRKTTLLLSGILLFNLAACSTNSPNDSAVSDISISQEETDAATEKSNTASTPLDDILIAYFSVPENVDTNGTDAIAGASIVVEDGEKLGNTEYVANLIQETVGGDLFCIETAESYPLDHDPLVDQAADEQADDLRPELATHVEDFEKYDYIFLGFPNWWGDMPQALYTFLEEYDFGGKAIIPFVTHGGSGASRTMDTISQLQPDALMMDDELILSRNDVAESEETVVNWARSLDINADAE